MKKPAVKAKPAAKPAAKAAAPPAHPGAVAAGGHAGNAPAKAAPAKKPPPKKKPPVSAKVKAARHAAAVKAVKTRAANAAKARKLSPGDVACCAAEAVAASLRATGWPVTDEDVLALYLRCTRDLDAGAPILATLEAAAVYGLADVRPVRFEAVRLDAAGMVPGLILGAELPDGPHAVLDTGSEWITWGQSWPVFPGAVIEEAWTVEWPEGWQSCT